MERVTHTIRFSDPRYLPLRVQDGAGLSEVLDIRTSPVLFGCRTGLCGTCTSVIRGSLPPVTDEEREVLDITAPQEPEARLLCQIRVHADLHIDRVIGAS